MPPRFTLTATDVLGRRPTAAEEAAVSLALTDGDGRRTVDARLTLERPRVLVPLLSGTWTRIELRVAHPDYAEESVTLRRTPGSDVDWDNRGALVTQDGGTIDLTLELGRIRQAPVTPPPFPGTKAAAEQNGVFFVEGDGLPRRYANLNLPRPEAASLWGQKIAFRSLKDTSGSAPTALGDPAKDAWDRLSSVETAVALKDTGGFLWLEYGSVTGAHPEQPRFLVGVWAPRAAGPVPKGGMDVVCYFTPSTDTPTFPHTTYPFRTGYPYAVSQGAAAADQPYVVLGYRHLMREMSLVQAQHASGRPALLVLPVFPALKPEAKGRAGAGEEQHAWQPFASQEGMHRLLLEVVHFLHRFGYRLRGDFSRWQGTSAPVDQLSPLPGTPYFRSVPDPPPGLRHVTMCGFSSAISGLFPLFTRSRIALSTRYPPHLFGGDADAFTQAWREWWDLDLELNATLTGIKTADYEQRLLQWLGEGHDRRMRMYHGQFTTGATDPARLFARLAQRNPAVTEIGRPVAAREWRDPGGRWSAAFYTMAFLRAAARPPGVLPAYPLLTEPAQLTHRFAAAIGFGHASTLRLAT
ncbi:hypothetical protein [Streptomyces sp. NPDC059063]|uniref:hypothetical protein n=1 Tax=unclassified Streptomyces TaxID=2593676 RepID=UPI003691607A